MCAVRRRLSRRVADRAGIADPRLACHHVEHRRAGRGEDSQVQRPLGQAGRAANLLVGPEVDDLVERREGARELLGDLLERELLAAECGAEHLARAVEDRPARDADAARPRGGRAQAERQRRPGDAETEVLDAADRADALLSRDRVRR